MGSPVIHALRQGYNAAVELLAERAATGHDHSGREPCRACAAAKDAAALACDVALSCAPPPELVTFRCWRCRDTEWIQLHAADPAGGTVRPCDRCAPDVYERWVAGHYGPGHDPSSCRECRELRRNR